jgi:hypothetical protein
MTLGKGLVHVEDSLKKERNVLNGVYHVSELFKF